MNELKFYICRHCGNVIQMVRASGVPVVCCGEPMQELIPNTVEASTEKHLPVVTVSEGKVKVSIGSVTHPMTDEHSIQWIYLETEAGGMRKYLNPKDAPEAEFCLGGEKPVAAYAYCNLHGLWKTSL